MQTLLSLEALGPRICICGPSNAGKSTLAAAIGRKLGGQTVHLDQLHHYPNTNWEPRPREEFVQLHAQAIAGDIWAMEGNYFALIPARLNAPPALSCSEASLGGSCCAISGGRCSRNTATAMSLAHRTGLTG